MTIVMEPVVIRGRRPAIAVAAPAAAPEPSSPRPRMLTNRAAGALRGGPGRVAFGGFGYQRTADDDSRVTAYARVAAARRRAADEDAPELAPPQPATAVDRAAFGGAAYERTADEDARAAAYVAADTRSADASAATSATPAARLAPAPARDTQPDAATGEGEPTGAEASGTESTGPGVALAASISTTGTVSPAPPSGIDTPAALVSAARTAADALARPEVQRAPLDRAFTPMVASAAARARRPLPRGGGGSYPPPRPVEPIEIDPVPTATAALTTALNARLPELSLPALRAMPDGTVPTLPPVRGVSAEELAVEVDVESPAADARSVNAAEKGRARAAARDTPDVTPAPAPVPVSPPVLVDFRRPPPPPLPQAQTDLETVQITRVLALVTATVDERSQTLIDQVRDQAFPPRRMGNYYLDVTDPMRDQIRTDLRGKLGELREAAGITVEVLDAAVAARRTELATDVSHVAAAAELEVDRTAATLTREAERENARAEARRLRDQARQVARYRRARHSRDPTLVEELVTARLGYIDADVGRGTTAIDAARTRRLDLIDQYRAAYAEAYRTADDSWQHPAGRPARAPPNQGGRLWYDVVTDELATTMTRLRAQTETDTTTLSTGLRDAGLAAKAAVRAWSDTRLRRTLTSEESAARTARDIDATTTTVADARAAATRAATRERLVGEIRFAAATALRTVDDAEGVSREHMINLNAEQLAQGQRFLATGDAGDPMSAVANNLVTTYARENLAEEPQRVRDAIHAKVAATTEEAEQLGDIYFPGGGGELAARVNRLWNAFEVWHGTAESDAIRQLEGLDAHATTLLNRAYYLAKGEGLQWRIDDEMSGSDRDQALGLASGDLAMHARGVIADSNGWFSNDPNRALDAIRNLPPGEAAQVVADPDTRAHLTTVLGGVRWVERRGTVTDDRGENELQILVELNRPADATDPAEVARRRDLLARADAIEFDRAVRRGTGGDAPTTEAVVARIRQSVTASAPDTWSGTEIDNEVRRRIRAMENAYEREFGAELPTGGVSALRTAVARYSSGTSLDLRQALLDVDRGAERASRLQRTTEGLYTSDSELNAELTRTYTDALAEVRRNRARREAVEVRARALMASDGITSGGRTPSPREVAAYRQEAEEEAARALAGEWMGEVGTAFAARYGRRWGGGADPLRAMVVSETQFSGETEALARLESGGGLTAARAVEVGQAGWGMDRDMVLGGLGNRTTQQLARISADYRTNTGGRDMVADLRSETGGWTDATADRSMERDAFDIREAMRGVPTTPQQEFDAARRRFEYERDVYFGGPSGRPAAVGPEFAALQRQFDRTDARMREWTAAAHSGDTAAQRRIEAGLAMAHDSVGVAAAAYRKAVDDHVEGLAQKVAIGVALAVVAIAAIATTILTGGLAAPAWVGVATAVAASLAGTAASMAVKSSTLGAAYGQNAFRTDLVVGAVDAIIAALTAGLGDKLLRLPRLAGATPAARTLMARSITAQRATRPVIQRMGAFGAEQIAQSVPTALTGAALNRDTWKGDPLRNFAAAGGLAALTGIGMGTAMHGVTTYAPRVLSGSLDAARLLTGRSGASVSGESVTLGSTRQAAAVGDVEAATNRGSWLERWAARRQFMRANPGAGEFDFQLALAQGALDAQVDASAVRALQAEMRAHLLSGLSGADAELARHARIEVLPDAEFVARTGSESNGYAATLNVRGEPVVVVREGAPLSRLAEEGRHVAQFFDPATSSRLALLDERRLAGYAGWSLADRVAAWRAKVDLELDVQAAMIPELRARLADPDLPAGRALDVARMLAEAEAAVQALTARRTTLDGLGPRDLARMVAGDLPPPRFLADEPRLFAKGTSTDPDPSVTVTKPEEWTSGGRRYVAEAEFMDGSRRSRWVEVWEGDELVEIALQRRDGGSWRLSGRVGRERGGIAEVAARLEHQRAAAAVESPTVQLRQIGGQTGSGAGLDDLWFRFETSHGQLECRALVYEAKNYDGQVSSFSAVDQNFAANVDRALDRLRTMQQRAQWDEAGMTQAQVAAAIKALEDRRIDVIIRTTQSTQVNPAHLADIQRSLNKGVPGKPVRVVHDPTPISEAAMIDAEALWIRMEQQRRLGYKDPDNILFKDLANGPQGMTPDSIAAAEAVVSARGQPGSQLSGKIVWAPGRTHLTDASGPFKVIVAEPAAAQGAPFDPVARARAILGAVDGGVTGPGGTTVSPVRVVVDYSELTLSQVRALRAALTSVAAAEGRGASAAKVIWTPPLR